MVTRLIMSLLWRMQARRSHWSMVERWVFLRKKLPMVLLRCIRMPNPKSFNIVESSVFLPSFLAIEVICFIMELMAAVDSGEVLFGVFTVLLGFIALAMLRIVWKCQWKIEQLKREDM